MIKMTCTHCKYITSAVNVTNTTLLLAEHAVWSHWIKIFNIHVKEIAKRYNANTIHWQDFEDSQE